ncbi:DUF2218 domain-containing protein [Tropicimonas sediminicola]|uniref:2,4-dihydroxyhept-2-ene-1,7-dioic acid aldolase n=1 Tax=Tropicimonas sediminicola TaxID=1031541 RepID=A0A239LA71_9RHOB|nr:DUF2218 domain-containing protein [Tropicimonas sediminicola]SNT27526.1 hypothetical protein SAMN05421757_10991 [Tropicimonas sediminicola]
MYTIDGTYGTPNASKYLQQLCKHFAHKVEVSFDEQWGSVAFPFGKAELSADAAALRIRMNVDREDALEKARDVIDRHLERFAFREAFSGMDWAEPVPA